MGGLIQKINERKSIRTEDIMGEISDNTSLDLLTLLDGTNKKYQINSSTEIAKKLSITQRKYHKLVARIKKLGLIKLGDSGLQLSSLGVIVVRSIGTIYNALDIYSKLRAIDIISMSDATT